MEQHSCQLMRQFGGVVSCVYVCSRVFECRWVPETLQQWWDGCVQQDHKSPTQGNVWCDVVFHTSNNSY